MPPARRGQRRQQHLPQHLPAATGGVGGSATAPRGDSSDKRCGQHGGRAHGSSRQAGFSRGLGGKDKGGGCSWEKMEPQEARGEGLAARGWRGWRGGAPAAGTEGTGGDRGGWRREAWGDPAPGAGSCQPDSIPIPCLRPGVLANPIFFRTRNGTAAFGSALGHAKWLGRGFSKTPFPVTALRGSVNLRHFKRFNIPGSQGLASSPTPLQAQASPARKAYFAPIYSPEPHFTLQFP